MGLAQLREVMLLEAPGPGFWTELVILAFLHFISLAPTLSFALIQTGRRTIKDTALLLITRVMCLLMWVFSHSLFLSWKLITESSQYWLEESGVKKKHWKVGSWAQVWLIRFESALDEAVC